MSRPIVCYYRCRRCKQGFERQHDKPIICVPILTTFAAPCPNCHNRGVRPYQTLSVGDAAYPLPDVEL
jgi:hypothetical protein